MRELEHFHRLERLFKDQQIVGVPETARHVVQE